MRAWGYPHCSRRRFRNQGNGFDFCDNDDDADVVLLNTCAIRDKAEQVLWTGSVALSALTGARVAQRIWKRLEDLRARKKAGLTVGVLGCMAERLKAIADVASESRLISDRFYLADRST